MTTESAPRVTALVGADAVFVRRLTFLNVAVVSVLVTCEWAVWSGVPAHHAGIGVQMVTGQGAAVFAITFVAGLVSVAIFRAGGQRAGVGAVVVCLLAASVAAVPQALVLARIDETPVTGPSILLLWLTAAVSYALTIGAVLIATRLLQRYQAADRARQAEHARAARAVQSLETEELRVRQMVADRLHGTIQNRMVLVAAGLQAVADDLPASQAGPAAELRRWIDIIDDLREKHVRSVSHSLFPTGADLGMIVAVRAILARIPPVIATALHVRPDAEGLADESSAPLPLGTRLTVVYAVEEAVTNALKHGARSVAVTVDAEPDPRPGHWTLLVTIDDDGEGLTDPRPPLNGLQRHRERVENAGGWFRLDDGPDGGTRLSFALPVARHPG